MSIMTPLDSTGMYFIQQVSDMTGLSKQVIRKWEERYNLVKPKRLENGYRVYSENDINFLVSVKTLSDQGYTIKQAVDLTKTRDIIVDAVAAPVDPFQHTPILMTMFSNYLKRVCTAMN